LTAKRFLVKQSNLRFPFALLEGDEHRHLSLVLRARPGKEVGLVDELGYSYRAKVKEVCQTQTRLEIIAQEPAESAVVRLVLGQAVLKGRKMDFLVQKATELGLDTLIPLIANRSVVRIESREARKVERWQKIAREAAKQSRRSSLPEVLEPQSFGAFLAHRTETRKFILTEHQGKALREILRGGPGPAPDNGHPSVVLAVGPEGGWTEQEEAEGQAHGFEAVSLGRYVLRSETAALAALAMISHFWSD
jgi:16S rRNA (uracil1498-N3)-methyltransferase